MINTLYYDYEPDGSKRPVWLCVPFDYNLVTDDYIPFHIDCDNFSRDFVGDFDDSVSGCSVHLQEITLGMRHNEIGVKINDIKNRIGQEIYTIERLILQVCDVAEVLSSAGN